MSAPPQLPSTSGLLRQHLIDPDVCIRCNTCEDTCKIGAITHDKRNYVVRFDVCNACGDCLPPCPTGAIDTWRQVAQPYSLEEQLSWDTLPPPEAAAESIAGLTPAPIPDEVAAITAEATAGMPGPARPPWSAAHPYVGLYTPARPAIATVTGNYRLTDDGTSSEIHHIVLEFGTVAFPVLEGQSVGVLPPGVDESGKPHHVRLYSVASPRNGERPNYNNLALTVKRVVEDHDGNPVRGVASNFLCDVKKGDKVNVVGPYGATFLMPNHPGSSLLMICTGTGAAPMRAMTERRRRRLALAEGGELVLFFGARTPGELPYHGPLSKLPRDFIDVNLAYSRLPGQPKQYVQDLLRARAADVARLLRDDNCYIYICGLKQMEDGVHEALADVCRAHGMDWKALRSQLGESSRFHVETY
jgi:benzoyl-CoA 2,3-dioxygenase component A